MLNVKKKFHFFHEGFPKRCLCLKSSDHRSDNWDNFESNHDDAWLVMTVEYLWRGWQKVDWMYRNYWELLALDKSAGDSHYIINICHQTRILSSPHMDHQGPLWGVLWRKLYRIILKGRYLNCQADGSREMGWGPSGETAGTRPNVTSLIQDNM